MGHLGYPKPDVGVHRAATMFPSHGRIRTDWSSPLSKGRPPSPLNGERAGVRGGNTLRPRVPTRALGILPYTLSAASFVNLI